MDNELLLYDRIEIIKTTNLKYDLENNAYISFSGGKDSTLLHYLLDMALPNNRIPRVFIDTGIEYLKIREFVLRMAENDDRFVILKPTQPIKPMLEQNGYPFKSKEFARRVHDFKQSPKEIQDLVKMSKEEVVEYLLSHKEEEYAMKGKGIFVVYFLKGIRAIRGEDGRVVKYDDAVKFHCPSKLQYLFEQDVGFPIHNMCCQKLKKDPAHKYEKESGRRIAITGMRREEGGQRENIQGCILTDEKGNLQKFHPLLVVSEDWEKWFTDYLETRGGGSHILCELYYPPYNFHRTGCRGCPFALHLQDELDTLEKLLPNEKNACEFIWKPVYEEYRRIGYRLRKKDTHKQLTLLEE